MLTISATELTGGSVRIVTDVINRPPPCVKMSDNCDCLIITFTLQTLHKISHDSNTQILKTTAKGARLNFSILQHDLVMGNLIGVI